jgi:hypothetical protein
LGETRVRAVPGPVKSGTAPRERLARRREVARAAAALALGALAAAGQTSPAVAAHGGLLAGVTVDFTGLSPVGGASGEAACTVAGVVHNGSERTVTVRVRYRAWDPAGAPFLAAARVVRVVPGERREFAAGPLVRPEGAISAPCSVLQRVEVLEAVADPVP